MNLTMEKKMQRNMKDDPSYGRYSKIKRRDQILFIQLASMKRKKDKILQIPGENLEMVIERLDVNSSIIHNGPKVKTSQMSITL